MGLCRCLEQRCLLHNTQSPRIRTAGLSQWLESQNHIGAFAVCKCCMVMNILTEFDLLCTKSSRCVFSRRESEGAVGREWR